VVADRPARRRVPTRPERRIFPLLPPPSTRRPAWGAAHNVHPDRQRRITAVGRGELRQRARLCARQELPLAEATAHLLYFSSRAELRRRSFGDTRGDDANPVWPVRYLALSRSCPATGADASSQVRDCPPGRGPIRYSRPPRCRSACASPNWLAEICADVRRAFAATPDPSRLVDRVMGTRLATAKGQRYRSATFVHMSPSRPSH
jgi:hypothetical protein